MVETISPRKYLILFLGADWWGSDARALAIQIRGLGHSLIEVGYEDYFPIRWSSFPLRLLRRVIRQLCARNFNAAVREQLDNPAIDFVLVFKGMLIEPETIEAFRARNVPVYCFYPDVGFEAYGSNIVECLPLYDCVFTTKSFHLDDPELLKRVKSLRLVSHGFDPEVHRAISFSARAEGYYSCDVSFVGCWSVEKERLIAAVISGCSNVQIKLWGPGWQRASEKVLKCWQRRGAYGDELAVIYQASKINIGLLTSKHTDSSSGDRVTARTWQVPAAGGFLLHERTNELADYFNAGDEVGVFQSPADLSDRVRYYLENSEERMRVATRGHRRCQDSGYTYAEAAKMICEYHALSKFS